MTLGLRHRHGDAPPDVTLTGMGTTEGTEARTDIRTDQANAGL